MPLFIYYIEMGTCASKGDDPSLPPTQCHAVNAPLRPSGSIAGKRRPTSSKPRPGRTLDTGEPGTNNPSYNRTSRNGRGGDTSGRRSSAASRSRSSSKTNGSITQALSHHSSSRMRKEGVQYTDFKDQERTIVERILEANDALKFKAINFSDLKLHKIIGAGAFGEVIKAELRGCPVVVKRMLRHKIDEEQIRIFGKEIQLMINLQHPNIVMVGGSAFEMV